MNVKTRINNYKKTSLLTKQKLESVFTNNLLHENEIA